MFAYRNYWQIKQYRLLITWTEENEYDHYMDKEYNSKWHKWQFALQLYIGVAISFISFVSDYSLLNSLGHGLLFGSVFWLIFDTLLGYLLTNSIFHVDSNGIGTIYKKLFKKYAPIALFVSKLLFVGFSVTLSII